MIDTIVRKIRTTTASNPRSRALRGNQLGSLEAQSYWLGKGGRCRIIQDISTLRLTVVESGLDLRSRGRSALIEAS